MSESAPMPGSRRPKRKLDPFSRPERWATSEAHLDAKDGRSREGQMMRAVRAELMDHVGETPSAVQKMLVEQAVMLNVHIARLDAEALRDGGMSRHRTKEYLAWRNSLRRTLESLGIKPAARSGRETSLQSLLGRD